MLQSTLSIVLPAYNEAEIIEKIVSRLRIRFPEAEILVVDDKSADDTAAIAEQAGARVVRNHYNMGNGAAIKTGARNATGEILVFMDADGQHDDRDIPRLIEKIEEGYDLVVGARDSDSQASVFRGLGNKLLNLFSSIMTGHRIPDLTSGFRAVRRKPFMEFLYLLPNGFSYPTTFYHGFFTFRLLGRLRPDQSPNACRKKQNQSAKGRHAVPGNNNESVYTFFPNAAIFALGIIVFFPWVGQVYLSLYPN